MHTVHDCTSNMYHKKDLNTKTNTCIAEITNK